MTLPRIHIPDEAQAVTALCLEILSDDLVGLYLHGSAVLGELRPQSDVDLLMVVKRELADVACAEVLNALLEISSRYPAEAGGPRCIELFVFVESGLSNLSYPARATFVYSEWLRKSFEAGAAPEPDSDPEFTLLLAPAGMERASKLFVSCHNRMAAFYAVEGMKVYRAMVDHRREILILTGTPGAGKTTTASSLAALNGSPKVHLHSDDFWHFIKHGAIQPYLPEAHQQNKVVLDVLANVAAGYARGGYFVIVDGIVGPWFLETFRTINVPIHYVVLRPLLEAAIERCSARGGNTLSEPEAIATLHKQFSTLGPLECHVLRTDNDGPRELLRRVIAALDGGSYRLAE